MTRQKIQNPSQGKVARHRDRLRQQGLRPIQIWVPDTRSAAFKTAAHLQSQAVAASMHARDDQNFIDSVPLHHRANQAQMTNGLNL